MMTEVEVVVVEHASHDTVLTKRRSYYQTGNSISHGGGDVGVESLNVTPPRKNRATMNEKRNE